jgi:hypothetical protein
MKRMYLLERLENFFLLSFYPLLFFTLFGILKILDGLYFQDFPLLIRAVIFCTGVFFGATFGYISAMLLFDHFFPRYFKSWEEIANKKRD